MLNLPSRSTVLVAALLLPQLAFSQQPTPPPPPPAAEAGNTSQAPGTSPTAIQPPVNGAAAPSAVSLSGQQAAKHKRHSRFSAGPGGTLLIFTETLTGLVTGGLVGASYVSGARSSAQGGYFGALSGGVLLGGISAMYQYYVPVGRVTSGLAALGSVVGALAGVGFGLGLRFDHPAPITWSVLVGSQLGVAATLAATYGMADISGEDLGLIGMSTLYATVLTLLGYALIGLAPDWPLAMAPAAGMAIGGLLATQFDLETGRALRLTALPLGIGMVLFYLGATWAGDARLAAATTLVGIGIAFGLTLMFTTEEAPEVAMAEPTRIFATPVILAAGRRNEGIAVGPGVGLTF